MGALSGISPKGWTMAAMAAGYAAMQYFDQEDWNSLANFLLLTGQLLSTAAGQGPAALPAQPPGADSSV